MNPNGMETTTIGDTPDLEIALLRKGIGSRSAASEHCDGCHRTLLIGERVYDYGGGQVLCALCRDHARQSPADSRVIHGPAFGHSIRVLDRRPLKHAA